MTLHHIEPERRTLHGPFSREMEPILTIATGDTVRFRTLDARWGVQDTDGARTMFEPRHPERDNGHALCGPVYMEGALPGMTLEIHIDALRTGTWGWQAAGGWDLPTNRALGVTEEALFINWTLDPDTLIGRNEFGHTVPLKPFMGVMGMPLDVPGLQSTTPPRATGGNMDCKELVAGSVLYLPIAVPGGLFSVGDGHGTQGDGEICGTAIECPMEYVDLTFHLREDLPLTMPRALTPAGWVTFGFDRDLNAATHIAVNGMLDLMTQRFALSRLEALALASLVMDIRVTQTVNDVCGVHAVLPPNAFSLK